MSETLYKLGEYIGMAARRVHPDDYEFHKGAAEVVDSDAYAASGRMTAQALYNVMCLGGRGYTAPAQHLKLLSKQAAWHPQFTETITHVLGDLVPYERDMVKSASIGALIRAGKGMLGIGGVGLKTLLLGSAGIGGAAGALHWGINRDIREDNAELEAMKSRIAEYDRLASQLEESLRHKYRYGD